MKRVFPLWLFAVLLAGLGAGCQRSSAPPANKPVDAAAAPAAAPAQAPTAQPFSGQPPAGLAPEAPVKPVPAVLPAVVATVNGEDVPRWELENALKQAEATAGSPVPPEKRDTVVRGILDKLVTYHMLAQQAHGLKLDVPESDIDAQMATIRKGFPTEDAYKQALLLQGLTPDQLRQQTRRALEAQKVVDAEVGTKLAVADPEVEAFYNQNIERFKQGDMVHASHIFIAVPADAPATQKSQARALAQRILKDLRGGADFAKVAQKESNDGTAANGGDLGFFGRGDTPPDFEKVVFGMKPGTMSDVVELQTGLHIIKVHAQRGPRTAPLAEVREDVRAFLLQSQRQAKLEQFIGQLKTKSKIQVLV